VRCVPPYFILRTTGNCTASCSYLNSTTISSTSVTYCEVPGNATYCPFIQQLNGTEYQCVSSCASFVGYYCYSTCAISFTQVSTFSPVTISSVQYLINNSNTNGSVINISSI